MRLFRGDIAAFNVGIHRRHISLLRALGRVAGQGKDNVDSGRRFVIHRPGCKVRRI